MIPSDGRVRLQMTRPVDRMLLDRVRRAARLTYFALRTPALLALGLFRHRERRPPAPSRVSRVLVIRTDRIGDMALTTPALGELRAHFRKAEITVLAPPAPLELLREHPAVDHLVPLQGNRLPPDLVGHFDLVIDFTPDEALRGALLARASNARLRVGFRAAGRQACFSLRGARAERRRHIVDLNRDLLDSLGVAATSVRPELYVSAEERGAAQAGLASRGAAAPRVAVHPGGHYPHRTMRRRLHRRGRTGRAGPVAKGLRRHTRRAACGGAIHPPADGPFGLVRFVCGEQFGAAARRRGAGCADRVGHGAQRPIALRASRPGRSRGAQGAPLLALPARPLLAPHVSAIGRDGRSAGPGRSGAPDATAADGGTVSRAARPAHANGSVARRPYPGERVGRSDLEGPPDRRDGYRQRLRGRDAPPRRSRRPPNCGREGRSHARDRARFGLRRPRAREVGRLTDPLVATG